MDTLKRRLTESSVLITLDLSPSVLRIIVNVDAASTIGWGAVLSQYQSNGEIHPARYESGIWSDPEKKYDALKLECPTGLIQGLSLPKNQVPVLHYVHDLANPLLFADNVMFQQLPLIAPGIHF